MDELTALKTVASKKHREDCTEQQRSLIAEYEGTPIRIEGFLVDAKKEGMESPNCHSEDDDQRDFHLYMVGEESADKSESVIVEMTPRVRKDRSGWTIAALRKIAKLKEEVRVSAGSCTIRSTQLR